MFSTECGQVKAIVEETIEILDDILKDKYWYRCCLSSQSKFTDQSALGCDKHPEHLEYRRKQKHRQGARTGNILIRNPTNKLERCCHECLLYILRDQNSAPGRWNRRNDQSENRNEPFKMNFWRSTTLIARELALSRVFPAWPLWKQREPPRDSSRKFPGT
jgi:hypothetical protein